MTKEFRNEIVRLADLTVNTLVLDDLTFSNCQIIGPAVIVPLDEVSIVRCGWDTPDFNTLFWEITPDRAAVIGAIGLTRCTFSACNFISVGIGGNNDFRATMESGFSSQ